MAETVQTKSCTNRQYFASVAANLIMIGFGCATGWVSMATPLLESNETPLTTGKLSTEDKSWIGAIVSIGAIVGNFVCGFIVTFIGARSTIFAIGFPQLVSWLFLTFSTCPIHLMASRFLSGFVNGGAQTCIFLFVAEIADNEIRGQLGTVFMYARNSGILIGYLLGVYFTYITSSYFFIGFTMIFLIGIWFVPSTPQYFLRKNNLISAQKSFNFYNKHRLQSDPKFCMVQFDSLKDVATMNTSGPRLTWRDIVDSRHGMLQAIIFSILNVLTAQIVFLTYGSSVIAKSGTHMPSSVAAIVMGVVQLFATFTTYKLIDSKGRKFLLILSLVGCAVSHAIMVAYMQINSHLSEASGLKSSVIFQFTPILCMASVIYMSSIGIVPLTFICTAESFPAKIRPLGMTFGNIILNFCAFVLFKVYPPLEEKIGLQACLIIFCISSTLGTIYVAILVEETKGKELDGATEAIEVIDTEETPSLPMTPPSQSVRRHSQRRMSQFRRMSTHRIEPFDARKYSVVSFA